MPRWKDCAMLTRRCILPMDAEKLDRKIPDIVTAQPLSFFSIVQADICSLSRVHQKINIEIFKFCDISLASSKMWRWSNFYIDKIFFLSIRAQLAKKTRILCIHLYINAIIYFDYKHNISIFWIVYRSFI